MSDDLNNLFSGEDKGSMRMFAILRDPGVSQVCINRHDRIIYWDQGGQRVVNDLVFPGPAQYVAWLNQLLELTDSEYAQVDAARVSVIEASFRADRTEIHGSVHILTPEVTRGEPALTIRKQPRNFVKLDDMLRQGMMSTEMRLFLQQAVHGRLNIVLSGGSGAGKTTLARALSDYIDPLNRVITVEEIDELHLDEKLQNVVSLTSYRNRDNEGRLVRETTLEDLVREALRMRGDRIWVGETRGREAYALTKACNSGHDGSITTIHADNGPQAVRQLVTYVMESGVTEAVAREQVSRAFHLVVQVTKEKMGRRVVREITELEPVLEGTQQRSTTLFAFDPSRETFVTVGRPSRRLVEAMARYGVNFDDYAPPIR
jgi:pilus assembly protein CpaF